MQHIKSIPGSEGGFLLLQSFSVGLAPCPRFIAVLTIDLYVSCDDGLENPYPDQITYEPQQNLGRRLSACKS